MLSRFVAKYPILKTMGAYFCINVAADFNEQVFIKKRTAETYNRGKTARIVATCTFVTSPMLFVWIRFIDKAIPGRTLMSVVKKVIVDAFCFAPAIISTFYITTNILEFKSDLTTEWKQKFLTTWTTGLCYWPFVQAVNFAMVPLKYKTCLYMPTASFIWMNYLCFMKDKPVFYKDKDDKDKSMGISQTSHSETINDNLLCNPDKAPRMICQVGQEVNTDNLLCNPDKAPRMICQEGQEVNTDNMKKMLLQHGQQGSQSDSYSLQNSVCIHYSSDSHSDLLGHSLMPIDTMCLILCPH